MQVVEESLLETFGLQGRGEVGVEPWLRRKEQAAHRQAASHEAQPTLGRHCQDEVSAQSTPHAQYTRIARHGEPYLSDRGDRCHVVRRRGCRDQRWSSCLRWRGGTECSPHGQTAAAAWPAAQCQPALRSSVPQPRGWARQVVVVRLPCYTCSILSAFVNREKGNQILSILSIYMWPHKLGEPVRCCKRGKIGWRPGPKRKICGVGVPRKSLKPNNSGVVLLVAGSWLYQNLNVQLHCSLTRELLPKISSCFVALSVFIVVVFVKRA